MWLAFIKNKRRFRLDRFGHTLQYYLIFKSFLNAYFSELSNLFGKEAKLKYEQKTLSNNTNDWKGIQSTTLNNFDYKKMCKTRNSIR